MDFQLFSFKIMVPGEHEYQVIYVLAEGWPYAFNEIYSRFGDSVTILGASYLGDENVTFLASPGYRINSSSTVITGVDTYRA